MTPGNLRESPCSFDSCIPRLLSTVLSDSSWEHRSASASSTLYWMPRIYSKRQFKNAAGNETGVPSFSFLGGNGWKHEDVPIPDAFIS